MELFKMAEHQLIKICAAEYWGYLGVARMGSRGFWHRGI